MTMTNVDKLAEVGLQNLPITQNADGSFNVPRVYLRKVIRALGRRGQMVGVRFIKKNGEDRALAGRLGAYKMLVGGQDTTSHKPEYIKLFESEITGRDLKGRIRAVRTCHKNCNLDTMYMVVQPKRNLKFHVEGPPCHAR